jgi:AraC-like DNA-binding protein
MTSAAHLHLARTYGGLRSREFPAVGGLSRSQEIRAKEILAADLLGDVGIPELAEACGMSTAHFARSFKATTGLPPHRWLIAQRIRKAKDLLRNGRSALGDIAVACGFSNQSHFTRVFSKMVGTTPGVWRQENSLGGIVFTGSETGKEIEGSG